MAIVKDWMLEAAEGIQRSEGMSQSHSDRVDLIRSIIAYRCPMKSDVAYMPVPRCEACKHWDHDNITSENTAECDLTSISAEVTMWDSDMQENEMVRFQMRTKGDFGCVWWEAK